ncbi:hypothetical protein B0H13DRAFT_2362885 [Mycena leptocephala]|nr:hypothetical protein B0H13DRAFT_2362885 [Mycena leptocephala]
MKALCLRLQTFRLFIRTIVTVELPLKTTASMSPTRCPPTKSDTLPRRGTEWAAVLNCTPTALCPVRRHPSSPPTECRRRRDSTTPSQLEPLTGSPRVLPVFPTHKRSPSPFLTTNSMQTPHVLPIFPAHDQSLGFGPRSALYSLKTTSGICLGVARMVVTTRSHALAALNSLRRDSLASIRRLPTYEAQFDALLASRRRHLYKLEGGERYMLRPARAHELVDAPLPPVPEMRERPDPYLALVLRRAQHYLAERLIHLRLFGRKAHAVPQICPGCGVKHREFFCLAFVGGLRGLDKLVKEVLGLLGQKLVKRTFFKSPAGLKDIWDLLI